jgi:hypothetical protein
MSKYIAIVDGVNNRYEKERVKGYQYQFKITYNITEAHVFDYDVNYVLLDGVTFDRIPVTEDAINALNAYTHLASLQIVQILLKNK